MLENKNQASKALHEIIIKSRTQMSINGITEIINFDENEVNLKTSCGDLVIEGEDLHVNVLNVSIGEVELEGKIRGVNYYDNNCVEKHSILGKIFK